MRNYPDYIIEQSEIDAPVYGQVAEYTIPHSIPYFNSDNYTGGSSYPSNALESQNAIQTPLIGGGSKLKTKLAEDVKKLFIRDMKRLLPKKTVKKIEEVYEKHKKEIQMFMGDVIMDKMVGGSYHGGAVECGENQYKSGDKCYDKEKRQTGKFDKTKFIEEQKLESKKNIADAPLVAPKPKAPTIVKDTVDDANKNVVVIPQAKDSEKSEDGFIDKFKTAVTPPERGYIFGTDESDLSDPRAWVDSVASIAVATARGVETVFEALDPFSWFL